MSCMMKLVAAVIDSQAQGRSLKSHDSYVNSNRSHEVIPTLPLPDLQESIVLGWLCKHNVW